MYQLAGFDEATAKKGMEVVMDVETRLAKAFRSRTELRDPHANYNKMSMEEFEVRIILLSIGMLICLPWA